MTTTANLSLSTEQRESAPVVPVVAAPLVAAPIAAAAESTNWWGRAVSVLFPTSVAIPIISALQYVDPATQFVPLADNLYPDSNYLGRVISTLLPQAIATSAISALQALNGNIMTMQQEAHFYNIAPPGLIRLIGAYTLSGEIEEFLIANVNELVNSAPNESCCCEPPEDATPLSQQTQAHLASFNGLEKYLDGLDLSSYLSPAVDGGRQDPPSTREKMHCLAGTMPWLKKLTITDCGLECYHLQLFAHAFPH